MISVHENVKGNEMINAYENILKQKLNQNIIQGYEVYYSQSESLGLNAELDKIKINEWDYEHGVGIRVLKNNKVGFAFGQRLEDAGKVIDNAVFVSKFNPVTKEFSFNSKSKVNDLKYNYVSREDESTELLLKDYLKSCVDIKGHIETYASLSMGGGRLINSEGMDIIEKWDSNVSLYTSVRKGETSGSESLTLPTFDDRFYNVPNKALENAVINDKGKKQSFNGLIIIQSTALRSLLSFYLSSFTGLRKHYNMTKFNVNDVVGSEDLNIIDDSLDVRGTSRTSFDMEGTPSKTLPIVEKGILKRFAYDRWFAVLDGLEPNQDNGFCSRGSYSSSPGIGFSNIVIPKGKSKFSDFDNVAVVESVFGLHTANPISGRFGLPIDRGYILSNGEKTGLKDVMLSGNIFEGLKNVNGIGNEQEVNGSFILPWVAVKGWEIF